MSRLTLAGRNSHVRQSTLRSAALAIVATPIIVGVLNAPAVRAQDAPDWQTRAGGKMAFEVASVKPSKGAFVPSNVSLTPWDDYSTTTSLLRADDTLSTYIQFAWKLWPNELQSRALSRLPKWVASDRYSIEARAATGNTTKDQMRLMVQSLLVERFHLAAHVEAREVPVFELRLAKADQRGPKLILHADGPPCDKPGPSPGEGLPGFPFDCHSLSAINRPGTTLILVGSRDVTMEVLAGALSTLVYSGLGRPLIDKTGIEGRVDFTLEWGREPRGPAASNSSVPAAPAGPTLIDALREQLGLKLEPVNAMLPILVVDRVERPSDN